MAMNIGELFNKVKEKSKQRKLLIKILKVKVLERCAKINQVVESAAYNFARALVLLREIDTEFGGLFDCFTTSKEAAYFCSRAELLRSALLSELVNSFILLKQEGRLELGNVRQILGPISVGIKRHSVVSQYDDKRKPKDYAGFWDFG